MGSAARRETPWIDIARQLAGDTGVEALGRGGRTTPPGTEALAASSPAAGAPVLLLFDEVLNFMNRHRGMRRLVHAFLQNLTVALPALHARRCISLPRSQVEMTDWDRNGRTGSPKVVRRVAKDLIANDESRDQRSRSAAARSRTLAKRANRKNVAKAFGDWCFERRRAAPAGMDGGGLGRNRGQGP